MIRRGGRDGFTLLEVVIALAILAIAMAAAARASSLAIEGSERLRDRAQALWVAQNRMAMIRMSGEWPPTGETDRESEQGNAKYYWSEIVSSTANKNFRRVEIRVYTSQDRESPAAELVGYIHNEREYAPSG